MDPLSTLRAAMPQDLQGLNPALLNRSEGLGKTAGLIPGAELKDLGAASAAKPGNFGDLLTGMVKEVSAKQAESAQMSRALLSGENVPLHRVMIASEEASLSFQLMVEVRNKLLESYQELMRMQV
jgi:flagellar hook-basal body complex protein FliE